jgi:hypothetical protein
MTDTPNKGGRPRSGPPQEIVDQIIDWLSDGQTLRSFCRQPGMPAFRTVYDWCDKDEEFFARFARAREVGHDMIAEETLELVDTRPESIVDQNGVSKIDSGYVQWQRIRIDQRLKLLAKWNPRKYGENRNGANALTDTQPININIINPNG